MSKFDVQVAANVQVTVRDGSDAITRVTGPGGDEWRSMFYRLHTEQDVLWHWAYNAVANNVQDASRLDGWADLEPGDVTLDLESIQPVVAWPITEASA